jgi:hypothetical protein
LGEEIGATIEERKILQVRLSKKTDEAVAQLIKAYEGRIAELEAAHRDIRVYVRHPDGQAVFSTIEKRVNAAPDDQLRT